MPFVQVDPSQIKFDPPQLNNAPAGFVSVDPSKIQFDKPEINSGDISVNQASTNDDMPSWFRDAQMSQPARDKWNSFAKGASVVGGALKDVGSNTLENLKSAATSTGEAILEPLNNPNASGAMAIPDAIVRTLGKAGNVIGGMYGAGMALPAGALAASVENSGVLPATASAIKSTLVPDDPRFTANIPQPAVHNVSMQMGSDLANAAMLGKANTQGEEMRANQANPPAPVQQQPAKASLLASNSSDPMQPPTAPAYTAPELKAASGAFYQQMRDNGATLNQGGINKVTTSVDQALKDSGLMNSRLHGDTMSIVADMKNDAATGQMDLEKLDQYRQLLGNAVTDNTTKLDGANQDAFKANVAINAIDKAVDSLSASDLSSGTPQAVDALNSARDLYSASARMRTMQGIIDNANMTDNPATAIKTGFRNLAKQVNVNPRGYTPEEVQAINNAAKTGIVTGALKFMGSRIISGISGGAAGAAAGAFGGGIPGAVAGSIAGQAVGGAIGAPFRAGANALQQSRAQNAINLVSQRPAVQAAMPAVPITPPAPPLLSVPIPAAALSSEESLRQAMKMSPAQARQFLQRRN